MFCEGVLSYMCYECWSNKDFETNLVLITFVVLWLTTQTYRIENIFFYVAPKLVILVLITFYYTNIEKWIAVR